MNVKSYAIKSFANFILGSDAFSRISARVMARDADSNMTGESKRQLVAQDIRAIGLQLANWALNLGIELAVAWARSKAADAK